MDRAAARFDFIMVKSFALRSKSRVFQSWWELAYVPTYVGTSDIGMRKMREEVHDA